MKLPPRRDRGWDGFLAGWCLSACLYDLFAHRWVWAVLWAGAGVWAFYDWTKRCSKQETA